MNRGEHHLAGSPSGLPSRQLARARTAVACATPRALFGAIILVLALGGCWHKDEVTRPKPGSLARAYVHSLPESASVWWDGEAQTTKTPVTIDCQPGEHHLRCVRSGYLPWEAQVQLRGDETRSVYAMLTPSMTSWLEVASLPESLPVWVDGHPTGAVTPARLDRVQTGSHSLRLPAPRFYREWVDTVLVTAAGRNVLAELAPMQLERDAEARFWATDDTQADGLVRLGRYLLVQNLKALVVFDVQDPVHLRETGRLAATGYYRALATDGTVAILIENNPDRVLIVTLGSGGRPSITGQFALSGAARAPIDVCAKTGQAYVGCGYGGAIVNTSDPRKPTLSSYLPVRRAAALWERAGFVYCSDDQSVFTLNVHRPEAPVVVDSLALRYVYAIRSVGTLIVVSAGGSLHVYEASADGRLTIRAEYVTSSTARSLAPVEETLFYTEPSTLGIVDLHLPSSPAEIDRFEPEQGWGFGPVVATDEHVFACDGSVLAVYSRRPPEVSSRQPRTL